MWRTASYEETGRGHKKKNIPCQDKTYSLSNDEVIVVALADGAGSAKYSHYGADCAVRLICSYVLEYFDELTSNPDGAEVKKTIIDTINKALELLAEELGCEIKDLASTLLMVAVKDDDYFIIHLGDGIIGCEKEGKVMPLSLPKNGEFINQTFFTTSAQAPNIMEIYKGKLGEIDGFILMSDGTATSLYDRRTGRLAGSVKNLFDWTGDFSEDVVFNNLKASFKGGISRLTTDDCSTIILKKTPLLRPSKRLPLPKI